MRAALLIWFLLLAVPAVGAETGSGEPRKEEPAETVSRLDAETLEILQMRELLELLEMLEDMDILVRMEEKE